MLIEKLNEWILKKSNSNGSPRVGVEGVYYSDNSNIPSYSRYSTLKTLNKDYRGFRITIH